MSTDESADPSAKAPDPDQPKAEVDGGTAPAADRELSADELGKVSGGAGRRNRTNYNDIVLKRD